MRDIGKMTSEYEMFSQYIDQAISLLLKRQDAECIRVLESLKLFSRSMCLSNMVFKINFKKKV